MDNKWISIITFTDFSEATIVHSMLEANGIQAVLKDENSLKNYTEVFMHGFIKIYVEQSQVDEAVKLLESNGYEIGQSETKFERKLAEFLIKLKSKFSFA